MSEQRKYTLDEIDAMRDAVSDLMTWWAYSPFGRSGTPPSGAEVEEQLRTYMLNGTDPDELVERAERERAKGMEDAAWVQEKFS